jgi:hypothetical protein
MANIRVNQGILRLAGSAGTGTDNVRVNQVILRLAVPQGQPGIGNHVRVNQTILRVAGANDPSVPVERRWCVDPAP